MNPLKGKVQSETPHTIKTAACAVYRKNDIAESKNQKKDQLSSPHGEEPPAPNKNL